MRTDRDLAGQRFGKLVAIQRVARSKWGIQWECKCDCGKTHVVLASNLSHKKKRCTQSCGCLLGELNVMLKTTHNMSHTPEHIAWSAAKGRCFNSKEPKFKYYGARGITMCSDWQDDFTLFLKHIGRRPSAKYSLHRIDNDGNYAPGNVKWATALEQRHNRRPHGAAKEKI